MRYRYIGELPSVLGGYSHGRNATITRADKRAPDDKPGSTVVIYPGDIVETDDTLTSLAFVDLDPSAASPYASMRKPELVALAGARRLDASGTVPELRERLDAFDAEQGSAGGSQENSGSDGHSDAGEILSPETGAQPLAVGDTVRLNEHGRDTFPGADDEDIAEIVDFDDDGLAVLAWAGEPADSTTQLGVEYLERVPDPDEPDSSTDDGDPAGAATPKTEGDPS